MLPNSVIRRGRTEARERIEHALAGPYTIISAERPGKTAEQNAARTAALKADLMSLTMNRPHATITPAEGRWQGAVERSFLVTGLTVAEARRVARRFEQDAMVYDGQLWHLEDCSACPDCDSYDFAERRMTVALTDTEPIGDYTKLETSAGDFYLKLS